MTPELAATIEDAYRVFSGYRIGSALFVCHCPVCMTPETERELIATPLRNISSHVLAEYTNSAHGWDDELVAEEQRYFLPRYLDLIARGDPPDHHGLAACLRRLSHADWRSKWPAAETEIMDRFFDAFIVSRTTDLDLAKWPVGWRLKFDLADVLTLIVTAHGDIARALDAWDGAADPAAALHMAALRERVLCSDGRVYLHSAYLAGDFDEEADLIGRFLTRPDVGSRLETAFFNVEDPRLQRILSDGCLYPFPS